MSDMYDRHPSEDLLQAFLDGDVSARDRRRIESHVGSCTRCAEELAAWRVLFDDLAALGSHEPSPDFTARVMTGVEVPAVVPWAARVKARFTSLLPRAEVEHLTPDVLQDFADGALTTRQSARVRRHIEACPSCASESRAWTAVLDRLSALERLAPAAGFAERVMDGLHSAGDSPAVIAPVASRRRAWASVLAGAKRCVPRTRRAWAAVSGVAVTPAVTFGLVLWAVFSHPTLTPQALASFALWQLTDLVVAAWGGLVTGGLGLARSVGLDGFIEAMVEAPLVTAAGLALYAVAFSVAARVLYKNLIDSRPPRHRYASASAS